MDSREQAAATAAATAEKAAQLVQHTAEVTASALVKFTAENTTLALNISYIQRDLAELKQDFRDSKLKYVDASEHKTLVDCTVDHESRIRCQEALANRIIGWGSAALVGASILEFMLNRMWK